MTSPLCPGGTQAKPGVVGIIIIAGALFELWLARRVKWLAPFIPFISPFIFDPSEVCAGEPPPFPDFSIDELGQLVTGGIVTKVNQAIQHLAWWEYCECIGATPSPPVIPPPAGLPLMPVGPVEACAQQLVQYVQNNNAVSVGLVLVPSLTNSGYLPAGATSLTFEGRITNRPPGLGDQRLNVFNFHFLDTAGTTVLGTQQITLNPAVNNGTTIVTNVPVPSGSVRYDVVHDCQPGGSCHEGRQAILDLLWQCGPNPNLVQPECCPPDPTLVGKLDRLLLQMALVVARLGPTEPLQIISTTSISGESQMPLAQGARMLNFQLTTLGADVQVVPYANPDRIRRAATVRFGNDFGWQRRQSIDAQDNLFPVPFDSQVVSWSLSPGTSGTLVQLGQLL
jgi:hypothetical protein